MVGRVQECGCIALPEDLQELTGLFPGATYRIELAANGVGLFLTPVEKSPPRDSTPGARCGMS